MLPCNDSHHPVSQSPPWASVTGGGGGLRCGESISHYLSKIKQVTEGSTPLRLDAKLDAVTSTLFFPSFRERKFKPVSVSLFLPLLPPPPPLPPSLRRRHIQRHQRPPSNPVEAGKNRIIVSFCEWNSSNFGPDQSVATRRGASGFLWIISADLRGSSLPGAPPRCPPEESAKKKPRSLLALNGRLI